MRDDLSDLIARIEAASEGSRELDLEIWRAKSGEDWRWLDREREIITCDRYGAGAASNPVFSLDQFSRSLDAALTLVPEDRTAHVMFSGCNHFRPHVKLWKHHDLSGKHDLEVEADTLPLALVSAALRARSMT